MVSISRESSASPGRLWSVITEVERWADRIPTVSSVTRVNGPADLTVGNRYELEQPGLPKATYEVTEVVPGERFVWVAKSPGLTSTATHSVAAVATGSQLDLAFEWAGPLAPLARRLGTRKGRELMAVEAERLTAVAEAGT
ncbi:MAG: SRPBCC family protein [Propionibacteriaceae bacterium]|nr:SRPBCC family protein [Propionibacteriaceae bacterium]